MDIQATHDMAAAATDAPRELVITRIFNAPRELVFAAWTDPEHLARWWGPRGFTVSHCELDARPGGALLIHMQAPDGAILPVRGVFREVVEPELLAFSGRAIEDADGNPLLETLTTVTFEDLDGRTRLTMRAQVLVAAPEAAEALAGMEIGWNQTLDRLAEHIDQVVGTDAVSATPHTHTDHSATTGDTMENLQITNLMEAVSDTADREIVVTRLFNAPRELVFDVWLRPEHMARWWGPNGFTTTTHEMEVKPGGVWRYIMHGPDGNNYDNRIIYEEVVRPERLVYLHDGDNDEDAHRFHVTVTFQEEDGKTRLTMRSLFATAEMRAAVAPYAIPGANQTLDRLGAYLATM